MISRSQLKFHETFQPELNYIAKILGFAAETFRGNKFDISNCTGIPTGKQKGKVEPGIKYAKYMGLVDYTMEKGCYALTLSRLGKEVFTQDKYLHESLSLWLCHYGITRPLDGAPQWSFLVHTGHPGFVNDITSSHLLLNANRRFGLEMPFEEIFGVVKRSYLDGFLVSWIIWNGTTAYGFTKNQKIMS